MAVMFGLIVGEARRLSPESESSLMAGADIWFSAALRGRGHLYKPEYRYCRR